VSVKLAMMESSPKLKEALSALPVEQFVDRAAPQSSSALRQLSQNAKNALREKFHSEEATNANLAKTTRPLQKIMLIAKVVRRTWPSISRFRHASAKKVTTSILSRSQEKIKNVFVNTAVTSTAMMASTAQQRE